METTSANKSIGLSYSRANEHCGKRIYYNDVVKMPRTYNYYSASGTLMEEMVASQLRPMIDGSPTVPMKQAGLKAIDEMISMLPKDELQQVMDELDASVTGAERYLDTVDYTPLVLQQKGVLRFASMARETKLVIDMLMNRDGEDVIVDFKRKPKKLSDYKISQQDWKYQLALYAVWFMRTRLQREIPRCEIHVLLPGSVPQIVPINVNAEDIFITVNRLQDLSWRLDHSYFPLNRNHPLCSQKWCQYYVRCHHDYFTGPDAILDAISDVR